jgi:hypothetical protein
MNYVILFNQSFMQKTIRLIFIPALFFFSYHSFSQIINIDKTDTSAYQKKAIWNGSIALALEVDKQSAILVDVSNFLDASLQKNKELFITSASDRFTNDGSTSYLNTGYVHLRWRHNYKDQLHPETFVQYQWDANRGMVYRYLGGINLRYNFWHKRAFEMTFATGAFYENEKWNYKAVDSSKIPSNPVAQKVSRMRSNNYIKWEGSLSASSNLAVIIFYQASYSDFFKPRISLNVAYDVNASRHFSLGIKYSGLYDAKPVVPIFNFYYNLAMDIAFKF